MHRQKVRTGTYTIALVVMSACASNPHSSTSPSGGGSASVTGTATYRERVELPPDASAEVTLIDAEPLAR